MFAQKLDRTLIQTLLIGARLSPRKRTNHCFHSPQDRLQRMINVALKGSYFAPHRHQDPDKLEIFTILYGRVMVLAFNDDGTISDCQILCRDGGLENLETSLQVEIPAGTWHSLVILSDEAVLYEVIDGTFDAKTHKRFAPFAPSEMDPISSQTYLEDLLEKAEFYLGKS